MLSRFLLKYRTRLILPVTVILAVIGFINIYFILNITPRTNDECIWDPIKVNEDSIKIVFDKVKFEGVTWNAGIRDGDEFLKIDGKKLRSVYQASYLADRKPAGDSLVFTVSRNGEVFNTTVRVKKLIGFPNLAFSLLAILWLIVGFVVISSKPFGLPQILFYRIGALFVMYTTSSLFSGNDLLNPIYEYWVLALLADILWVFGGVFLPFIMIYFFWVFPLESKIISRKYTSKILLNTPLVLFVLAMISRIYFVYYPTTQNLPVNITVSHSLLIFINVLFMTAFVIGLISLFRNYFKLKDPNQRTAIFVILIAYTIGLISIVYINTFANVLADSIFNQPEYFLPIFLIVLLPLAFAYSIFKYSLLDVSDVLKNTILYGTATFSLAGVYFLLIYLLGQTISEALTTDYQGVVAAGIFIIFAFVFQSTKDRFQNVITKYFYPEQFAYQKVLMKFSNEVSTIVGRENILDTVQETFVDALKVKKFGIAIKDKNSFEYKLVKEDGFINKDLKFINDQDIISKEIREKLNLKHPNAFDKTEFPKVFPCAFKLLEEEGVYTVIPLKIKNKIIGLLLFGLKHSGAQFAGKDIDLLIASANQTAVSLENARLYEEEAKKIKLERDLDVARQIQESMLPKEIPSIKNIDVSGKMIPAMQVGGDYFDLIKVSETQMFIIVGDVSGKGLPASFYMSKLQTMVQLFCKETNSPKEVLVELNNKIAGKIERQWFITLTVAFVDIGKRQIKISRAGHTPTIYFSNGVTKYLKPQGIGVGLEFGKLFEESLEEIEMPLTIKDSYIFTSDGVNEAMDDTNNLYGYDRIINILKDNPNSSSKEIIDLSVKSLEQFRGAKEPNDDITLVVLKIL